MTKYRQLSRIQHKIGQVADFLRLFSRGWLLWIQYQMKAFSLEFAVDWGSLRLYKEKTAAGNIAKRTRQTGATGGRARDDHRQYPCFGLVLPAGWCG